MTGRVFKQHSLTLFFYQFFRLVFFISISTNSNLGLLYLFHTGNTSAYVVNLSFSCIFCMSKISPPVSVSSKYCKRGFFAGGNFRGNVGKIISRGGNFHNTTSISLIKSCGLYFARGKFWRRRQYRKNAIITPTQKFQCLQSLFGNEGGLYCRM